MIAKTIALFIATALAEIAGCYLPYLWLRQGRSIALLVPAGLSLALFVWLLTLHPQSAGRTYASYGGVYVATTVFPGLRLTAAPGENGSGRTAEPWDDERDV